MMWRKNTTVQPDPRAYVRIAAMVREMISSQVLPPGSPAPSITKLCREHDHARQTCGRGDAPAGGRRAVLRRISPRARLLRDMSANAGGHPKQSLFQPNRSQAGPGPDRAQERQRGP